MANRREGSNDRRNSDDTRCGARAGDERGDGGGSGRSGESGYRSRRRMATRAQEQPGGQGSDDSHRGEAEVASRARGRHEGGDERPCGEEDPERATHGQKGKKAFPAEKRVGRLTPASAVSDDIIAIAASYVGPLVSSKHRSAAALCALEMLRYATYWPRVTQANAIEIPSYARKQQHRGAGAAVNDGRRQLIAHA